MGGSTLATAASLAAAAAATYFTAGAAAPALAGALGSASAGAAGGAAGAGLGAGSAALGAGTGALAGGIPSALAASLGPSAAGALGTGGTAGLYASLAGAPVVEGSLAGASALAPTSLGAGLSDLAGAYGQRLAGSGIAGPVAQSLTREALTPPPPRAPIQPAPRPGALPMNMPELTRIPTVGPLVKPQLRLGPRMSIEDILKQLRG